MTLKRNSKKTKRFGAVRILDADGNETNVISINKLTNHKPQPRIFSARESNQYNSWRKDIKERDKYRCVLCEDNHRLEVHHIKRWIDDEKERFNEKNGVTLCLHCHNKYHGIHNAKFPQSVTDTLLKYIDFVYKLNKVISEDQSDAEMSRRSNRTVQAQ